MECALDKTKEMFLSGFMCLVELRMYQEGLTLLLQSLNDVLELLSCCQWPITCDSLAGIVALTSRTAVSSSTFDCRPSNIAGSIIPEGADILHGNRLVEAADEM